MTHQTRERCQKFKVVWTQQDFCEGGFLLDALVYPTCRGHRCTSGKAAGPLAGGPPLTDLSPSCQHFITASRRKWGRGSPRRPLQLTLRSLTFPNSTSTLLKPQPKTSLLRTQRLSSATSAFCSSSASFQKRWMDRWTTCRPVTSSPQRCEFTRHQSVNPGPGGLRFSV